MRTRSNFVSSKRPFELTGSQLEQRVNLHYAYRVATSYFEFKPSHITGRSDGSRKQACLIRPSPNSKAGISREQHESSDGVREKIEKLTVVQKPKYGILKIPENNLDLHEGRESHLRTTVVAHTPYSCSFYSSCSGSNVCGSRGTTRRREVFQCQCDFMCWIYGDCCFDYYERCLGVEPFASRELVLSATLAKLATLSNVYSFHEEWRLAVASKCTGTQRFGQMHVISECNKDSTGIFRQVLQSLTNKKWGRNQGSEDESLDILATLSEDEIIKECQKNEFSINLSDINNMESDNPLVNQIPVMHLSLPGVNFKNVFCGVCNGVHPTYLKRWSVEKICKDTGGQSSSTSTKLNLLSRGKNVAGKNCKFNLIRPKKEIRSCGLFSERKKESANREIVFKSNSKIKTSKNFTLKMPNTSEAYRTSPPTNSAAVLCSRYLFAFKCKDDSMSQFAKNPHCLARSLRFNVPNDSLTGKPKVIKLMASICPANFVCGYDDYSFPLSTSSRRAKMAPFLPSVRILLDFRKGYIDSRKVTGQTRQFPPCPSDHTFVHFYGRCQPILCATGLHLERQRCVHNNDEINPSQRTNSATPSLDARSPFVSKPCYIKLVITVKHVLANSSSCVFSSAGTHTNKTIQESNNKSNHPKPEGQIERLGDLITESQSPGSRDVTQTEDNISDLEVGSPESLQQLSELWVESRLNRKPVTDQMVNDRFFRLSHELLGIFYSHKTDRSFGHNISMLSSLCMHNEIFLCASLFPSKKSTLQVSSKKYKSEEDKTLAIDNFIKNIDQTLGPNVFYKERESATSDPITPKAFGHSHDSDRHSHNSDRHSHNSDRHLHDSDRHLHDSDRHLHDYDRHWHDSDNAERHLHDYDRHWHDSDNADSSGDHGFMSTFCFPDFHCEPDTSRACLIFSLQLNDSSSFDSTMSIVQEKLARLPQLARGQNIVVESLKLINMADPRNKTIVSAGSYEHSKRKDAVGEERSTPNISSECEEGERTVVAPAKLHVNSSGNYEAVLDGYKYPLSHFAFSTDLAISDVTTQVEFTNVFVSWCMKKPAISRCNASTFVKFNTDEFVLFKNFLILSESGENLTSFLSSNINTTDGIEASSVQKMVLEYNKQQGKGQSKLDESEDLPPFAFDNEQYELSDDGAIVCFDTNRNQPKYPVLSSWREITFKSASLAERVVSLISSSISIVSLAVVLFVYASLSELRNVPGMVVISLSSTLLLSQVLFLLCLYPARISHLFCQVYAAVHHAAWLAAFFWLTCMAINLVCSLHFGVRPSSGTLSSRRFLRMAVVCWGIPFCATTLCFFLDLHDVVSVGYGKAGVCWIGNRRALLYVFVAPVLVVIFTTIVGCMLVVRKVSNSAAFRQANARAKYSTDRTTTLSTISTDVSDESSARTDNVRDGLGSDSNVSDKMKVSPKHSGRRNQALMCFFLSLLMGGNWIFYLLAAAVPDQDFLWILTSLFSGSQGLYLLLCFVAKPPLIMKVVKRWRPG
ncbi:class B secretin G-protein coupled receptor GPRmth5 [Elysia marginata]|uniref:Class B secretin G-protein coupled receptor GPRmth5 n=1 Tax=Elysia marginata TaxID=1093978 RepID=A0AAV4EYV8_9GAST|nr:class B secretin G-protein coupled receptor GPRmth5 [Elysia marginata]